HDASCALVDGQVWCWGVSLGKEYSGIRPQHISSPIERFVGISRANAHACALTGNGQVWCAGSNRHGELGGDSPDRCALGPYRDGSYEHYSCSESFIRVPELPRAEVVVAGSGRTCAISTATDLFCWGEYREEREKPATVIRPRRVAGLQQVADVALTSFASC